MVTPLKTLMGFSVHLNVQLKFYNLPIGLIALYCILHAGPLNLLVFFGMLVIANVAEILIG
ncbi:hypothetical protein CBG01_04610 [Limosilactobacillus reuteri]|uniref:Uncharacterized protein n=1 Tax=Limosilactobacillus reuteri TaxID=1598 RepID=A0A256VJR6_LIMRT|nr:hypothetical protein CBF88_04295 [Limosilactobacillus reuteri]OYS61578.1 hypothetical protein CBF91_05070 [Limosilactobacillus reuteri]OYS64740.1 hypothetical protein CBF89_04790 [Limosilactobacillus reuteri]OYS72856.1 hypothetical protein CBG01_04610 [Limosilactobacillus reuteri]OYS75345.1 hypothetical protein CBG08_04810 [Limosilactobacillus reuteri]